MDRVVCTKEATTTVVHGPFHSTLSQFHSILSQFYFTSSQFHPTLSFHFTLFISIFIPFYLILLFHSILQEKEQKYSLRLEDMKVRDIEGGRFSIGKKYIFGLFYTTGK